MNQSIFGLDAKHRA